MKSGANKCFIKFLNYFLILLQKNIFQYKVLKLEPTFFYNLYNRYLQNKLNRFKHTYPIS